MGQRGPVPKRSSERRRRNKDGRPEKVPPPKSGEVKAPPASRDWHPIARAWYRSLKESGQARFYEPSDWQAARYVAEVMSRHLAAERPSAQLFTGIWSAMTDLLTTEAARRRVRIEVERGAGEPEGPPAGVTALDDYRRSLGA